MYTYVRHMQVTASKAIASETIRRVDPGGGTSFHDMTLHMQPFAHPPQDIASFESRYLKVRVSGLGFGMRDEGFHGTKLHMQLFVHLTRC